MTRKQYIRKMQSFVIAVHRHPTTPNNYTSRRLGDLLRETRDKINQNGIKGSGYQSYADAWNCDVMQWARHHYGLQ